MADRYVDLEREFLVYDDKTDQSRDAIQITKLLGGGPTGIKWPELLQKRRVVILGEPGSGKSTEFENQAARLVSRGEFCLLISLSDVVARDLTAVLLEEQQTVLNKWRRTDKAGYLFLDSVDESRLRGTDDFRRALQNVRRAFTLDDTARLHIFISSRATAWQSMSDLVLVRDALGPFADYKEVTSAPKRLLRTIGVGGGHDEGVATESKSQDGIECYRISELDLRQVKRYAEWVGIGEVDRFLQALRDSHAEEFATRPADIEVLAAYWKTHQNLGTLSDLMEFHVSEHLRETLKRRPDDRLSMEKLREGAEQLAAVTLLARQTDFDSPFSGGNTTDGLNIAQSLPHWPDAEIGALLQRSIFDSEYMGKIKFHHRNTSEYLAASWFKRLMEQGLLYPNVVRVLFASAPDNLLLRPSLAPVAAWLCCLPGFWTDHLQGLMLKVSPETFFLYGDPSALSADYRGQVLKAITERLGTSNAALIETRPQVLARVADDAHTPIVAGIIRNVNLGRTVRRCAFLIAVYGKLRGTVDAALEAIEADGADLKDYAFEVVDTLANNEQRRRMVAWLNRMERLPVAWIPEVCSCVYPHVIDESALAGILAKGQVEEQRRYTSMYQYDRFIESAVRSDRLNGLLRELLILLRREPYINPQPGQRRISAAHAWLLPLLPKLLSRILTETEFNIDEVEHYAQALAYIEENRRYMVAHDDSQQDFTTLTRTRPAIRQALFEHLIEERPQQNAWGVAFSFRPHDAIVRVDREDAAWLLKTLGQPGDKRKREAALHLLEYIFEESGNPMGLRRVIRASVSDDPDLVRMAVAATPIKLLSRLRLFWYRQIVHKVGQSWWWSQKTYHLRIWRGQTRDVWFLNTHLVPLWKGQRPGWLSFVLLHSRTQGSGSDKLGVRDWGGVARTFGPLVAIAVKEGCERCWRLTEPPLPHERQPPGHVAPEVSAGLAILGYRADDTRYWNKMTADEARRAVRYALNEINGFAEWLPRIQERHPVVVAEVLSEALTGEYSLPANFQHVHNVAATLAAANADMQLVRAVGRTVADLLRAADPPNATILRYLLRIALQGAALSRAQAAGLCRARIALYAPENEQFSLWLTLWVQVEATAALDFVDAFNAETKPRILSILCGGIVSDDIHSGITVDQPDHFKPEVLRRLLPSVLIDARNEVRPPPGIVWGPSRDHSSQVGGLFVQKLANDTQAESLDVLKALQADPTLGSEKDWLTTVLHQRLLRDSETMPWAPADTAAFAASKPLAPRTAAELYERAVDAVDNVKDMVELSDASWRNEVRIEWHETSLRLWLAGKLRHIGAGKYVTAEELEDARRNRTDIRLLHPAVPGNVVIELKWAQNWSLGEHFDRFENQLCIQYLQGESRHGIYLLVFKGNAPASWGNNAAGQRLTLDELRASLEVQGATLRAKYPGIRGLKVMSINCN